MSNAVVNGNRIVVGGNRVVVNGGTASSIAVSAVAALPWRKAAAFPKPVTAPFKRARVVDQSAALDWGTPTKLHADDFSMLWRDSIKLRSDGYRLPWRKATFLPSNPLRASWKQATSVYDEAMHLPWQMARRLTRPAIVMPWSRALHKHTNSIRLGWSFGPGTFGPILRAPWQKANVLISDGGPWVPTRIDLNIHRKNVELHFCRPYTTSVDPLHLDIYLGVDPCENVSGNAPVYIIEKRVYMTVNSFQATTLSDNLPLPFYGMSIQADAGSFGWTFSAAGPQELMERLSPVGGAPVEIGVVLNGLTWKFGIEGVQRNRSFGEVSVSVTGRSLTMLAGDPYNEAGVFTNLSQINAQQQATNLLDTTGVSLDWNLDDWLLPASSFSFQGTPLAGIQNILEVAGGILQSHRVNKTLIAQPYYPTMPWEWATTDPDIELPLAVVTTESFQRADQPNYRGMYVVGNDQQFRVVRAGTDGFPEAPMFTSPMAADPVAATQKGKATLGRSGAQATIALTLPVLVGANEPGVIDVNKLVQIADPAGNWKGIVRSVQLNATLPDLMQTITLERHL
jgi:hypothetical protein